MHFKRCIDTVKAVLVDAKTKPAEVGDIVLVGGSTRIVKVQSMLSEYFGGRELCKSINPDEAVAYGAAVQGAILMGSRSSATQSLLLVDVTPLSLGIELTGKVMSTLIKRNTPVPVRKTKQYSTEEDYQTGVDILVFEGERAVTDGNNLLGEFHISGIERAKRGVPKIDVTFDIDVNGILTVSAMDVTTKARANITISNSKGRLSSDEVDRMVMEAERMKREDAVRLAIIEARNELEPALYQVADIAAATNNADLAAVVDATRTWLDDAPPTTTVAMLRAKTSALQAALSEA